MNTQKRLVVVKFSSGTEKEVMQLLEDREDFMTHEWYNHQGFILFIEILERGWIEVFHRLVEIYLLKFSEEEFTLYCSMIKDSHGRNLLHFAVRNPQFKIIKPLLSYMTTDAINKINFEGTTPLHVLAKQISEEAVECAKIMVKESADTNKKRNYWETPLVVAIRFGNLAMIKYLGEIEKKFFNEDYINKLKEAVSKRSKLNFETEAIYDLVEKWSNV